MSRLIAYLKNSRQELRQVVWPSRQQTIQHTLLVIGISLAMAAFLGGMDYLFTRAIELVI